MNNPTFQSRVFAQVERHNAEVEKAKHDLPLIEQALPAARIEHAERVDEIARGLAEERAQEQEHPKHQDRGRVRSLWDDDGPKPGRGRGDGGMHL